MLRITRRHHRNRLVGVTEAEREAGLVGDDVLDHSMLYAMGHGTLEEPGRVSARGEPSRGPGARSRGDTRRPQRVRARMFRTREAEVTVP